MSLQRMGLYRYGSATKKAKREGFDNYGNWNWMFSTLEIWDEDIKQGKANIDEDYLFHYDDIRRDVDIYLYVLGFIKGVFPDSKVPFNWKDTYNGDGRIKDTGTLYREGDVWHTENSDWFYKRNYICPRGTSYFCGEPIRICICR